ncbi:hypothetical protein HKX48_009170 [Thoreauomyces humboldtii]|nr:hypothetical protein HKX48_009170 [Thoreauomyces humboldtii]
MATVLSVTAVPTAAVQVDDEDFLELDDEEDFLSVLPSTKPVPSLRTSASFKKLGRLNAVVRRFQDGGRTVASPLPSPTAGNGNDTPLEQPEPVELPATTMTVDYFSSKEVLREARDGGLVSRPTAAQVEEERARYAFHTVQEQDSMHGPDIRKGDSEGANEFEVLETETTVDYLSKKEVLLEDLYEVPGIVLVPPVESPTARASNSMNHLEVPTPRACSPSRLGRRSRKTVTTTTTTTTTSRSRSRSRDGRSAGVILTQRNTTKKVTTVILSAEEENEGEDSEIFFDADDAAWADDSEGSLAPLRRPTTIRRKSTVARPATVNRRNTAAARRLPSRRGTLLAPETAAYGSSAAARRRSTLRRPLQSGNISDLDEEPDEFLDALDTVSVASGRSRASSSNRAIGPLRPRTTRRRPTLARVPTTMRTGTASLTTTTTRKRLVVTTTTARRRRKAKPKPARSFLSALCSRTGEGLQHVATAAQLASKPLGLLGMADSGLVSTASTIAHAAGASLVGRFGRRDTQMRVQAFEDATHVLAPTAVLERMGVGGWMGKTIGSGLEAALDGGVVAGVGGLIATGAAMSLSQAHSGYLSMAAEAIGHFGNVAALLPPELQAVAEAAGMMGTVLGGVGDDTEDPAKLICDASDEEDDDDEEADSDQGDGDRDDEDEGAVALRLVAGDAVLQD